VKTRLLDCSLPKVKVYSYVLVLVRVRNKCDRHWIELTVDTLTQTGGFWNLAPYVLQGACMVCNDPLGLEDSMVLAPTTTFVARLKTTSDLPPKTTNLLVPFVLSGTHSNVVRRRSPQTASKTLDFAGPGTNHGAEAATDLF
jgi:hypothetical protein